jgi:hypothetical protein
MKLDRNIIDNFVEFSTPIKEVKDVMKQSGIDKLDIEVPLNFTITLNELNDWDDDDTLDTIIYKDREWDGSCVDEVNVRIEP